MTNLTYKSPAERITKLNEVINGLEDSMIYFAQLIEDLNKYANEAGRDSKEGDNTDEEKAALLEMQSVVSQTVDILEFGLLLNLILLDMCIVNLQYEKSQTLYERQTSLKHGVIIINESYKRLYNFPNKGRGKSMIFKIVKPLVCDKPLEKATFDKIVARLDNFLQYYFLNIKDRRNLSAHYDIKPSQNFMNISSLESGYVLCRFEEYYKIIFELFSLFNSLITEQVKPDFDNLLSKLQALLESKNKQLSV